MKRGQSGFTLVEIAIVLVIIGLLIGGVLKGQEMITQGRIKNAIIDFSGVTAAYYAYIDRYKALPGDDSQATSRWGAAILPTNAYGNGDGVVTGNYYQTTPGSAASNETADFWLHLRAAGLVTGSTSLDSNGKVTLPVNSSGSIIGVQTGDGNSPPSGVLKSSGSDSGLASLMICSSNLPDRVAAAVDAQLDDGRPNTGSMRAKQTAVPDTITSSTNPMGAPYSDTGTALTICRAL